MNHDLFESVWHEVICSDSFSSLEVGVLYAGALGLWGLEDFFEWGAETGKQFVEKFFYLQEKPLMAENKILEQT